MKKISCLFLAIISFLFIITFVSAQEEELICDINKGTLGDLQVGKFLKGNSIVESIGSHPEKIEKLIVEKQYRYFNKGIIVVVKKNSEISQIYIYYNSLKEFDGYYKKFHGTIKTLGSSETMESIINKFGKPDDRFKDMIYDTPEFVYNKFYGTLHFCFDKSGRLNLIIMQQ